MDLKVELRDKFGGKLDGLKKSGFVPAELYGRGVENLHLSVPVKDFRTAYRTLGEGQLLNLVVGGQAHPVLIHEVTQDPLTDEFRSIDFYQVNMNEEIRTVVPIKFEGVAPAVKNFGGILVKAMDEIKIEALPANIPQNIVVDLSKLENLNQSIYVKDLKTDGKFKLLVDKENVVITVSEQEEEEVVPVVSPEAAVAEVKVESEEKKAAREAEKASAETGK